jgi:hypothetical protein
MTTTLRGGPFDGATVPRAGGTTILVHGPPLADHQVAWYCWSPAEQGYLFHETGRVDADLPPALALRVAA